MLIIAFSHFYFSCRTLFSTEWTLNYKAHESTVLLETRLPSQRFRPPAPKPPPPPTNPAPSSSSSAAPSVPVAELKNSLLGKRTRFFPYNLGREMPLIVHSLTGQIFIQCPLWKPGPFLGTGDGA